jgi:hypothetical protein
MNWFWILFIFYIFKEIFLIKMQVFVNIRNFLALNFDSSMAKLLTDF